MAAWFAINAELIRRFVRPIVRSDSDARRTNGLFLRRLLTQQFSMQAIWDAQFTASGWCFGNLLIRSLFSGLEGQYLDANAAKSVTFHICTH